MVPFVHIHVSIDYMFACLSMYFFNSHHHHSQVLEVDVDDVPWKDDIVTVVPDVTNGVFTLPAGPGWGVDIDEEALKLHPAMSDAKTGIWSTATKPSV